MSGGGSFHGISLFGGPKKQASSSYPSIRQGFDAAKRAVEWDEKGQHERAFALYQEAVGLLLQAVKEGKGDAEKLKTSANAYLTRAEELSLVIATRKPQAEPEALDTKKQGVGSAGGRGAGSASVSVRGGRGRGSSASATAARRPSKPDDYDYTGGQHARRGSGGGGGGAAAASSSAVAPANEFEALVMKEMLEKSPGVTWEMIAGLSDAKQTLQEVIVLPSLRPDLFKGLRAPPKGVLLYGPPGTGKTLLAKAVASESGQAFIALSASSLVSKFLGEGEKMVRAVFAVARKHQPATIFLDEIDAVLGVRGGEQEHEASRRLKTEFLLQLDGVATEKEDRILVMGATNLPWALDEAILRRLAKKVYIPLPDKGTRLALLRNLLQNQKHSLQTAQLSRLVDLTEGYSCSDLSQVAKDAAMGPIRDLGNAAALKTIKEEQLRPIKLEDFERALRTIRPSVSPATVVTFEKYLRECGYT